MTAAKLRNRKARARAVIARLTKLFPNARMILRYGNHWELLVAVELSAQCTDKKVNEVTERLFKKYRTLDAYIRASASQRTVRAFEADIRKTGFYRNKAKNILGAARMVAGRFGGTLPQTIAEMVLIPGVGRKTANVILGNAYGIVEGIAVDTHVQRLTRRLGLTDETNPEKIERDLMAVVPKKGWFRFTYLLIDYGRAYCTARVKDHSRCPLAAFERHDR